MWERVDPELEAEIPRAIDADVVRYAFVVPSYEFDLHIAGTPADCAAAAAGGDGRGARDTDVLDVPLPERDGLFAYPFWKRVPISSAALA